MNYFTLPGIKPEKKVGTRAQRDSDMDKIIICVCDHFGISEEQLLGKRRPQKIADARHVIFYLSRKYFGIGPLFAGQCLKRDHTSAVHGWQKIENLLSSNDGIIDDIIEIRAKLNV